MHELSLAQEIAHLVLNVAAQKGAKSVLRIELEIGELSFLSLEQVKFWLKACLEGTIASKAEVILLTVKPVVRCDSCGYEGDIQVEETEVLHFILPVLLCPGCGSDRVEVVQGRDCILRRIEVEV
ncbi:TPA: hydrogenase maturation nickel metallochaperone HypA [Candidatus Poribacteria bacterium]|nr:hydrogenase maturation nickel metallochaperone HypA [Candidatus Poribacteria bacterium]